MEPLLGGLDGCPTSWFMATTPADRAGPVLMTLHNDRDGRSRRGSRDLKGEHSCRCYHSTNSRRACGTPVYSPRQMSRSSPSSGERAVAMAHHSWAKAE
jgi:hypothetical protein